MSDSSRNQSEFWRRRAILQLSELHGVFFFQQDWLSFLLLDFLGEEWRFIVMNAIKKHWHEQMYVAKFPVNISMHHNGFFNVLQHQEGKELGLDIEVEQVKIVCDCHQQLVYAFRIYSKLDQYILHDIIRELTSDLVRELSHYWIQIFWKDYVIQKRNVDDPNDPNLCVWYVCCRTPHWKNKCPESIIFDADSSEQLHKVSLFFENNLKSCGVTSIVRRCKRSHQLFIDQTFF